MIGVVDYGAGNLQSVANALDHLGLSHKTCAAVGDLAGVERLLLPGVGHFGAASRRLRASGLGTVIAERARGGLPLLGICLGLQLLVDASDEAPDEPGLGLIRGRTVPLELRCVPHMGWNRVTVERDASHRASPGLFSGDDFFYFAHGYVVRLDDPADCLASTEVDDHAFPAAIGRANVQGVQFHPEKSGDAGLALLEAFARC